MWKIKTYAASGLDCFDLIRIECALKEKVSIWEKIESESLGGVADSYRRTINKMQSYFDAAHAEDKEIQKRLEEA